MRRKHKLAKRCPDCERVVDSEMLVGPMAKCNPSGQCRDCWMRPKDPAAEEINCRNRSPLADAQDYASGNIGLRL